MHQEIENLLRAYLEESNRENRLIQDVLTALAVGAAARQRMIRDLSAATTQATLPTATYGGLDGVTPSYAADIGSAIGQLRAAHAPAGTH